MTVNSIFPFKMFMIIGEAIAVGAIAVIKTTSARGGLNWLSTKNNNIGKTTFIAVRYR